MRFLPIWVQACLWCKWCARKYAGTSHFKLEAIRGLRKTAKIPLKDAARLVDRYFP